MITSSSAAVTRWDRRPRRRPISYIAYSGSASKKPEGRAVAPCRRAALCYHSGVNDLCYRSTRSEGPRTRAERAILEGLAPDGGLYVPERFPSLPESLLDPATGARWADVSFAVLEPFLPAFPRDGLRAAVDRAAACFPRADAAPLAFAGNRALLELFHGPTLAFKDVALSLMGGLLDLSRRAAGDGKELLVLTATSGDTGKAALSGLAGLPGLRVLVFYPAEGVSGIQRLQMLTHEAAGACVVGVRGNFDDAQRGVKELFADPALRAWLAERGVAPSSANSINIGRLLPQVAYFVSAYRVLRAAGRLASGERLDVVVPTGNFGDVLAAYYAKRMGLPLGRLVVASNRNRVLADFFATGRYDRNREFFRTTSPSMDILVSSNLERLVFEATGRDPARVAALAAGLAGSGAYGLSPAERAGLADFAAESADEGEAAAEIARTFREDGYLLDPHTAVAAAVERKLRARGELGKAALILATASPFKFPTTVARAIGLEPPISGPGPDSELETAAALADRAGLALPAAVGELRGAAIRHREIVDPSGMEGALRRFVEGGRQ